MVPVSSGIAIIGFCVGTLIGMATGALTGTLACLYLRVQMRGLVKDALLGWLGLFLGYTACVTVFPTNTVTSNAGPNPSFVAFLGAALFPLLREIYRFKRLGSPR
jgi:hypothetical protein